MKKKNEFSYFEQFTKAASLAKDATKELKNYISNFNGESAAEEKKKIHDIENQADNILHELKRFLLKDFLPPIDREDIVAIAHKIDDLVDEIDEVVIDIDIFIITEIKENMKKSIELLETAVGTTYDLIVAMNNLKNVNEIKNKVIEVNKLEEEADKLYENSVKELYKNEKDPIQIIKWSRMYETLEDCFDACENIADCIEEVLLKNG
ncbi:MAG: DUF47 family protein [Clostridia bacterium]|nr:DUF47 family protein [Clostridia bacterium]